MIFAALLPFKIMADLISAGILCGELVCLAVRCM